MNSSKIQMEIANPNRKNEGLRGYGFQLLRFLRTLLPNRTTRRWVGEFMLRFKQNIPRELMIYPGYIVVQIGTPQTETLRRISKNIGPTGRALIVEADETNIKRLQAWAVTQGCSNLKLVHRAAANRKGEMTFLVSKKWSGNHRLLDETIENDNDRLEIEATGSGFLQVTVMADTVDGICSEHAIDSIDYLEIAINGSEFSVLSAMPQMLRKTNSLFVKGHSRDKQTGQPICHAIKNLLEQNGFKTRLTRTSKSHVTDWGLREGDVYAWRT